jgi:D-xylose transport system permease protein
MMNQKVQKELHQKKIQYFSVVLKQNIRNYAMPIGIILLGIIFTILTDGVFLLPRNISNLARQMSVVGILGSGMVIIIVSGNIDLSVGSVLGISSGLAAVLIAWNNWGIIPTILVVLAMGLGIGLIQGLIIGYGKVPAFIVTLGGLIVFKGALLGTTKGVSIAPFTPQYQYIGQGYLNKPLGILFTTIVFFVLMISVINERRAKLKYHLEVKKISYMILKIVFYGVLIFGFLFLMNLYQGVPIPVTIMILIIAILNFVISRTMLGRKVYAIGGNIEASKYSGINVEKTIIAIFTLMGVLSALAGIVYSARINAGTTIAGQNMELDAIAAAVIGGASFSGGVGKVPGAILGALFMAMIDNGMSLLNVEAFWQFVAKGVILVSVVWFDIMTKKNK